MLKRKKRKKKKNAVARSNENNYLFLPSQLVCYLVCLMDNNNTNGFQFSITFTVVMNNLLNENNCTSLVRSTFDKQMIILGLPNVTYY